MAINRTVVSESGISMPLSVVVIGAGIGGLVCAIACRKEGLSVTILEQATEIKPVGAGIQVPPNSSRILESLGLLGDVRKTANEVKFIKVRRYANGNLLAQRPIRYSSPWFVIHRADYHDVLLHQAKQLGATFVLNAKVVEAHFETGVVTVESGLEYRADVIIGADGLWSTTRTIMLGETSAPFETGDLAYRGTFSLEQLKALNDPYIEQLCKEPGVTLWLGPDKHCVFYPVKSGTQFNIVLVRPDDIPAGVRTAKGDISEMRFTFAGWDPVLTRLISCIPSVLKWKLLHLNELTDWTMGRAALLGDACHPTLPYQAQGAAMAVEDGATLGKLLGNLNRKIEQGGASASPESVREVLKLYENCQKRRTTTNVRGAIGNQVFYHMRDGPEQEERDMQLASHTFTNEVSKHYWLDTQYNRDLLEVDILAIAQAAFDEWYSRSERECHS